MCLRHCRDIGELQFLPKKSYCVFHLEEDSEAIIDPLLPPLPPYKGSHLQGAQRGVWPLGDGGLQRLERPRGPVVSGDALLYIGQEQVHRWVCPPLRQTYQYLLLLNSKEQHKGRRAKDLPGSCLSRSCQVIRQCC